MQKKLFYNEFGALLEETRKNAGLTQDVFSKRVGLSRASIANIEKGRQRIPFHMLYIFADALGVNPEGLMPKKQLISHSTDYELDTKLKNMRIEENSMKWIKRVIKSVKDKEEGDEAN